MKSREEEAFTESGFIRMRKMMRITVLFLVIVLSVLPLAGCAKETFRREITVEGAIFGGKSDDRIAAEIRYDPAWITKGDNTAYNPDLAAFCALLSTDIYFREKDLPKGTQNRILVDGVPAERYDWTVLLTEAGFTDVRYVESHKAGTYDTDTEDSATLVLGYQKVQDRYDTYVAVFRGSFSAQEWVSAFDPGFAGAEYTALTGKHPEWKDTENLKGLDIGAARALSMIESYMEEHDDPSAENCILLTGHSRGAGLANIAGAQLETDPAVRSFTYTFNCMPVTVRADAGNFCTVYNVFDAGDFYTELYPFANEKVVRFGKDLSLEIADSDPVKAEIAALKGREDYVSASKELRETYRALFESRFADRKSLYEPVTSVQRFSSKEEAESRLAECESLIGAETGLGLSEFCRMGEISQAADGMYELPMEYCGAALIRAYAKELAYGKAAYEGLVSLFSEDETGCLIADLLMENAAALNGGHLLSNSYVLTKYVK